MIDGWKTQGVLAPVMVQYLAQACLGWPYVWGAYGQYCTPANRRSFAARSACPPGESEAIIKNCPVCSGKQSSCEGCKYYPGGKVRFFDCRGFTRWVFEKAGIKIEGAGATSQWNTNKNWTAKGPISDIPLDKVEDLFWKNKKKAGSMAHTGLYLGGLQIIHCSGEVKWDTLKTKGWTDWAEPVGLYGGEPMKPTIKRGSTGPYVVECQEDLIGLGYNLDPYGADGKFGKKTEDAVKAFQTASGLKADGIVGPATWTALDAAVGPAPDPEPEPPAALYTVIIPHVSLKEAEELQAIYPDAEKRIEGGGSH